LTPVAPAVGTRASEPSSALTNRIGRVSLEILYVDPLLYNGVVGKGPSPMGLVFASLSLANGLTHGRGFSRAVWLT
jgi:hypothetical protein